MRNLLLTLQYDGSVFHGWQVQKNAITIQEVFQNAVEKVFGERLNIVGCSRTDTGVHANMYCCNIKTDLNISKDGIIMGLNTYLPDEIAVIDCTEVSDDFHARYHCKSKEYVYKLYNGKVRNPFLAKYTYFYRYDIDVDYLDKEAQAYVGTYDYSGFCSTGSKVGNTIRTVKKFNVWRENDMVYFKVEADGFLYNMVRIMVGTLLFVAQGKIKENQLKNVILSKDRKLAGKTAPASGLYLNKVNY